MVLKIVEKMLQFQENKKISKKSWHFYKLLILGKIVPLNKLKKFSNPFISENFRGSEQITKIFEFRKNFEILKKIVQIRSILKIL